MRPLPHRAGRQDIWLQGNSRLVPRAFAALHSGGADVLELKFAATGHGAQRAESAPTSAPEKGGWPQEWTAEV